MAEKTTQQLVYRALTEMGRLYTGDAPSDEDFDLVNELVEPLVEQLNEQDVVFIDDINAIAPKWFLPLARLLAIEAAPSFGNSAIQSLITNNRADNLDALRDREQAVMREINATRPTYAALKGNFF